MHQALAFARRPIGKSQKPRCHHGNRLRQNRILSASDPGKISLSRRNKRPGLGSCHRRRCRERSSLYPMNALVNDQLGRLRLDARKTNRLAALFKSWGGRPGTLRALYEPVPSIPAFRSVEEGSGPAEADRRVSMSALLDHAGRFKMKAGGLQGSRRLIRRT